MPGPDLYYIERSSDFFRGAYRPKVKYSLKFAKSLQPDNVARKRLDFGVVALRLSTKGWGRRNNNGILTCNLNLAKSIKIKKHGPVDEQTVRTLHYTFAFKKAKRGGPVAGMAERTVFQDVSAARYLSKNGRVDFSLEIGLARSGGGNTNTIIEVATEILKDPTVKAGLAATVPFVGIASAVFEVLRTSFFGSGQAQVIWPPTFFQFKGTTGVGYPLKVGRYVFVSAELDAAEVEAHHYYRGGRLIDDRKPKGKRQVTNTDQFYLDIYAS